MNFRKWNTFRLDDLGDLYNNKRIPLNSREREKRKGLIPYYGASGIVDYVDDFLFEGEYVLISEDGENLRSRKTPIAFIASGKFWVNNHAHIFQGSEQWINNFIVYYFQNLNLNSYITGAVQPKLNKENLLNIPIQFANKETAKRIASILSSLDNAIKLNQKTNETLDELGKTIFEEWFVNFNLPNCKRENQPFVLNNIPTGWEIRKLKEVVEIKGGSTPSTNKSEYWDGDYFWATPKDLSTLQTHILLDTNRKITEEGLKQITSGILPEGTLLLSSRAPIGYLAISQIPVSINQGFIAINGTKVSNLFMLYWLKKNMQTIINHANGSTFLEINKTVFRDIEIILPTKDILDRFEKIAQSLHYQILKNEKEIRTLSSLRDTLLPQLMNGKIELSQI